MSAMGPIRTKILPENLAFLVLTFIALVGCGGVSNGGGGNGGQTPQAVIAIDVQPANIVQGQTATISWQVTKATTFSISPSVLPAGQTYPMTGSAQVSPSQTTTYTATAVDANGLSTTTTDGHGGCCWVNSHNFAEHNACSGCFWAGCNAHMAERQCDFSVHQPFHPGRRSDIFGALRLHAGHNQYAD